MDIDKLIDKEAKRCNVTREEYVALCRRVTDYQRSKQKLLDSSEPQKITKINQNNS